MEAGIPVSCLMVLTSRGVKAPINYLDFFSTRNLHLKINPLLNYGEVYKHPELSLGRGEYANYLIHLYEVILEQDSAMIVSPLDKILRAVLYGPPITECTFNSLCNQNFICIDHAGMVYPCGKYSDLHEFCLGPVEEQEGDILDHPFMCRLRDRRGSCLPGKCRQCVYQHLCNAGCSAEASIENNFDGTPFLCEDYQMLFRYFKADGLKLLKRKLLTEKRKLERQLHGI